MDRKQLDRMYDGIKLTDEQLDHVIGGVSLSPKQAVAAAPQLQLTAMRPGSKPLARK